MSMFKMAPARRNRILLWLALGLLVAGMLWVAHRVLLPYVLGIVLAYILLPVVNWIDRHLPRRFHQWHVARPLSILLVYLVLAGLIAGTIAFVVPVLVEQANNLIESWPSLSNRVQEWGTRGWGWYQLNVPAEWQVTIETYLKGLANDALRVVRNGVLATVRTVFGTISFIIGLVVIPFWLFYILHDESRVKAGVLRAFPEQLQEDVRCLALLIDDVLSAYLRGQLVLVLIGGVLATIALFIIGVPFAPLLGLVVGLFEVIPYVGPILGAMPAVLVALLSRPVSALWVVVSFAVIRYLEDLIVGPRIVGKSVKLHPALVMVVLVIGNEVAGLWGMLLAVPLTGIVRDVFKYLYLRLLDEPLSPEKAMASVRTGQQVQMGV